MLRCYDSKRQNQEGWSSLHAHFGGKRHRFTTLNHKQKNLQRCRACDCAQKIFDLNKTAEGRLGFQPAVSSVGHKGIVIQLRVGTIYAVNLLFLSGTKSLMRIQAPNTFEQSLSSQYFMHTGDAAREVICGIKKRRIAVGHL